MSPVQWLQSLGFPVDVWEQFIRENKATNHAHFPPSDEPLSWDTKGKVVTLDVAVMAAHLMTARLVFGGFRSIAEQALRIAQTHLQKKLTEVAAAEIATATEVSKKTVGLWLSIATIWEQDGAEEVKELKIRKESLAAQRDVWKCALAQSNKRRKRRNVQTRHAPKRDRHFV